VSTASPKRTQAARKSSGRGSEKFRVIRGILRSKDVRNCSGYLSVSFDLQETPSRFLTFGSFETEDEDIFCSGIAMLLRTQAHDTGSSKC
jgi:hypothetical protein